MLPVDLRTARLAALAALALGCGRPALPDPKVAARAYADAAAHGDAERLHGLLTREAQRNYGLARVRALVQDERAELAARGAAVTARDARVEGTATLVLADGGRVELALEPDGFRVAAADTLPAAARTPTEALDGLRRALARRSYTALLRVLSAESRNAVETEVRALATALENPATLDVRVQGDRADVDVGGGHQITLRREDGTWRVEDIQ
ncbi:MAG TPA: hypothetical protein VMI54_14810 [Polyangiaceae bacterium]|nr:hypothetical protein [Polyangiaceae bacterium]